MGIGVRAPSLRLHHEKPAAIVEHERTHLAEPADPLSPLQMKNRTDRAYRLPSNSGRTQICKSTERLESCWHVRQGVCVQGSASPIVPGVESAQQLSDLGAAAFAEHEPVWAHPERFT